MTATGTALRAAAFVAAAAFLIGTALSSDGKQIDYDATGTAIDLTDLAYPGPVTPTQAYAYPIETATSTATATITMTPTRTPHREFLTVILRKDNR